MLMIEKPVIKSFTHTFLEIFLLAYWIKGLKG